MHKFNVGDKVRNLKPNNGGNYLEFGELTTIVKVHPNRRFGAVDYTVRGSNGNPNAERREHELESAEKFKIGDRVKNLEGTFVVPNGAIGTVKELPSQNTFDKYGVEFYNDSCGVFYRSSWKLEAHEEPKPVKEPKPVETPLFKIGDRVKNLNGTAYVPLGVLGTVKSASTFQPQGLLGINFDHDPDVEFWRGPDQIEASDAPSAFKVGDRVKNLEGTMIVPAGTIGTIEKTPTGARLHYVISFDNDKEVTYHRRADQLEAYEEPKKPEPKFKTGDRIKNLAGTSVIPFGEKGTIIGLNEHALEEDYDIDFDCEGGVYYRKANQIEAYTAPDGDAVLAVINSELKQRVHNAEAARKTGSLSAQLVEQSKADQLLSVLDKVAAL